jgi:hypothetical protein
MDFAIEIPKDYDINTATKTEKLILNGFEKGETKIRILGLKMVYETWGADNNPIRYRALVNGEAQKAPRLQPFNGREFDNYGKQEWKYTWFLLAWSYAHQAVKVFKIQQKTVQGALLDYYNDVDLGDFTKYDVKIKKEVTKKGNKDETKYLVKGLGKEPLSDAILAEIQSTAVNLNAMVYNGYPDDPEWHDKALQRLINNLDKATQEAANRGIELEIPASTDLAELQTAWERAIDLMPLQKTELPKVEAKPTLTELEDDAVPF